MQANLAGGMLALMFVAATSAPAVDWGKDTFVLTSTNDPSGNHVVVFRLTTTGTPALSVATMLPTGGNGGAGGNAGIVQFDDQTGAVANYGSNTVTELVRHGDSINTGKTINLAPGCTGPVSVALKGWHLYVAGANCAESHTWPSGTLDGTKVALSDSSVGQIVVGKTWAGITMKSGTVQQLALTAGGALAGTKVAVTLPSDANNTPLGAAFWGDIMGFNPAHSADSFALVDKTGDVYPVLGPQPAYPSNAPCWLAKGAGSVWYAGNSPGQAVSIFFSDDQGGVFYKSVPVPGVPTDLSVSPDGNWLAVIYTASDSSGGHVAVFSIDAYGGLTLAATSETLGIASFNGVAISQ
jgi:hypothetical protein